MVPALPYRTVNFLHLARSWRRPLILLAALPLLIGGGVALAAPWLLIGNLPGYLIPELHRWHEAQWGAILAILIAGGLVAMAVVSESGVLIPFVAAAVVAAVLAIAPHEPFMGVLILPVAAAIAVSPAPKTATAIAPTTWRFTAPNGMRLATTVLTAIRFGPDAWRSAGLQYHGLGGEHATFGHWGIAAALVALVVGAGLLAATGRPGADALAILGGLALIYLGAAALTVPRHDGSWGESGGAAALLLGTGFLASCIAPMVIRSVTRRLVTPAARPAGTPAPGRAIAPI